LERLENHGSLDLVESDPIVRELGTPSAAALLAGRLGKADVVGLDGLPVRHEHRSLDRVAKLANVAGPAVSLDAGEGLVGEASAGPAKLARELGQEVSRERLEILRAFTQRRESDPDHVQAEVEVLPEARTSVRSTLVPPRR
jgi:hypothetical protein